MPTNQPPSYLRPWSIVEDEELGLLRELRSLCDVLKRKDPSEVIYMQGVASGPFESGRVADIIRRLERMGR